MGFLKACLCRELLLASVVLIPVFSAYALVARSHQKVLPILVAAEVKPGWEDKFDTSLPVPKKLVGKIMLKALRKGGGAAAFLCPQGNGGYCYPANELMTGQLKKYSGKLNNAVKGARNKRQFGERLSRFLRSQEKAQGAV